MSEDREIIAQVLSGDVEWFALLISRYKRDVFATVHYHVPPGAVEEVAHETFVRAFEKLSTFNGEKPFKNWLRAIAMSRCMDYWRRASRQRELSVEVIDEESVLWPRESASMSAEEHLLRDTSLENLRRAVQRALDTLPAQDRILIGLIYKEELNHGEIAEVLGWSVAKVKVRAHRVRKKLRTLLLDLAPSEEGKDATRESAE